MIKQLVSAAIVCSIAFAATGALAAAERFEAAVVQGTLTSNPGYFRVEVATGKVWQAWGAATEFTPTVDEQALPPGDYHIVTTANPAPDGRITWSLNRLDSVTGRSWVAIGGGNMPLVWHEIVMPK